MTEYLAVASGGKYHLGKRMPTYGTIISLDLDEDTTEIMHFLRVYEKEGVLNVRYNGSSLEEARKSIQGLDIKDPIFEFLTNKEKRLKFKFERSIEPSLEFVVLR